MTGHDAISVAETSNGIVVAIDHFDQLTIFVVTVLHQGFDGEVVDHTLDVGQATQRIVVMQVNTNTARGADVGKRIVGRIGEVQVMPQGIFNALQLNSSIVVRHFAEIEESVVECL
ncbi:hypothetical protein PS833_06693 [Pseudomonas fluorescens]|uniref:Uncharacterized protein n=1 Tax=Pseudomonas fluorescens TaxID=294 RepID=A0A5E7G2P8_PSEFL|nr:hypothetical protein PS833_06693 [Pseudomonas fluorescens]